MDEDEGLDMLIAQRSQRPSFARMISWEFNDADETKVVSTQRRQRQRSKQQSGETTQHMGEDDLVACGQDDLDPAMRSDISSLSLEGLSDSDEEFFSAEEFYISDSEPGTGESVVSVSIEGQDEAKCVRNTGEECESDEDRVFTEQNANLNSSSSNIRPSRLSKKQKKKRRKEVCIMYENELRPFMDIEFDDIVPSERTSVGETLDISKDVPSLVQLCIKSAYKINLKSMPELPNKLKCLFCLDEDFSLQKFQLSWLHSTLSRFEPEEKFADNCMSKDGKDKPAELLHPARNVWNKKYRLNHTPKDYKGSEVSATLPFTILDQASDMGHKRAIITWAVVAATVELMMPPFLSAVAYRHQSESEDDRIVQATRSVMARLKYAMKNRFPTVVSHCFDDVVPYALWARGDLHQATEYFMSLSQSSTKESLKGLYLNEVGRMHAQIGAMETAAKFYRLASDAVLMDGKNSVYRDEVTTQMLMLVANLYDQGILTPQKGKQSAQAWNVVKTNKYSHKVDGLERHIVDTYFCTHCGSVQGREWLEQAKPMLIDLSTSDPKLLYYLSLVHALLGEEKQAHTVYWDYVKGMEDSMASDGRAMVSLSGEGAKCNPWRPLVTMVKEVDTNVQFLPVLWRMQLQHLKVFPGSGLESDICSKTLDLHFDSSGCLTGNMHMLLPPIRRVRLNPYTGALQFDQHNSPTKVLTAWDRNGENESIAAATFVIPTLLEVYNQDGIKVHFMLGQKAGNMSDGSDMATLIWTGPHGQKARLNIVKLFREHCIKEAKESVARTYGSMSPDNILLREDAQKFIDLCLAKQRVVDVNWICSQVQQFAYKRREFNRCEKSKLNSWVQKYNLRGRKAPPREVKYSYEKPATLNLQYSAHPEMYRLVLTHIAVLGNFLIFFTKHSSTQSQEYLWTVDLESRDAFLASKVPFKTATMTSLPVRNQVCHTIPGANLLLNKVSDTQFKVTNIKKMKELEIERVNCCPSSTSSCADISRMFLFGSQLFGISFNSRIWSWSKEKSQGELEDDEFAGTRDLDLIGNVLVVSTDRGIKFSPVPADHDQVLYSLPVVLSAEFKGTPLTLNKEGTMICKGRERIKVTGTQEEMRNGKKVYRAAISLDNIAVVMLVPSDLNGPKLMTTIEILMAVTLPGYGTETCFISQQVGVLFGWSHSKETAEDYREHVFQVDYDARLRGVLPFLGYGPRSFLPVYLPGDSDIQAKHPGHGQAGWYVFMRDGHEGIIGIKLFC